jgi:hypothetical protein
MMPRIFRNAKGGAIKRVDHRGYCQGWSRRSGCCETHERVRVTWNSTTFYSAMHSCRIVSRCIGLAHLARALKSCIHPCPAVSRLLDNRDIEMEL